MDNQSSKNLLSQAFDMFLPNFFAFFENYFRLEPEGLHHLPKGQCVVYANHSGFNGMDALMLAWVLRKHTGRLFRTVAHPFWFTIPGFAELSAQYGLIEADPKTIEAEIEAGHSILLFPEGESGNFKPSSKMYQIQDFRSGLVRLCLKHGLMAVPCTILGAEESSLTIAHINIAKFFFHGLKIPIPLNLIPLPSKWYIKFHEPIHTEKYRAGYADDIATLKRIQRLWKKRLQIRIFRELRNRRRIFLA